MEDLTNLRKELEITGVEAVAFLTRILSESNKYATGNLIRSLDFKIINDVNGLMLKIMAAPYFKYVDEGRRPGKQPPIKPIQSWIEKKEIQIKNYSSKQSAFIIARSIGKKGIQPMNLTERLIRDILNNKQKIIKSGAVKDIQAIIDKTFIAAVKTEMEK